MRAAIRTASPSCDLGLASGELAAEIVEPACLLLQVRGRRALGLLPLHLRLASVQLGLSGGQLALLGGDLGALGAHRRDDLAGARALLGKPLEVGREPVCLRLQLGLARLEVLLARGHGGAGLDEFPLALCDVAIAVGDLGLGVSQHRLAGGEHRLARLDARCSLLAVPLDLGESAIERPLALGERRFLLRELRRGLGALSVCVRQLAKLVRNLLLALRRARLGGGKL